MTRTLALLASLLFLSACASSWPSGTAENGYPILPREGITVYESLDDVPGMFKVLGVVANTFGTQPAVGVPRVVSGEELERLPVRRPGQARVESDDQRNSRVKDAQRTAATLGANGVLLITREDIAADARLEMFTSAPLQDGSIVMIYVGTPPEASGGGER